MKTKKIELINGFAEVPATSRIANISKGGDINHVGVIMDKQGKIEPVVVLSDSAFDISSMDAEELLAEQAFEELHDEEALSIVREAKEAEVYTSFFLHTLEEITSYIEHGDETEGYSLYRE